MSSSISSQLYDKLDANHRELFTSSEEYQSTFHDMFDRFSYYLSNNTNVFTPVVSQALVENGYTPKYPLNKSFAVCLTHDIDVLNNPFISRVYHCLRAMMQGDKKMACRRLKSIFNKKKPYYNLQEIMNLEEKYDAKSTFYFMALNPGDKDYNYNIDDIKNELKLIDDKGWEVGLHGSHDAWNSYETLINEKERLEKAFGKKVVGYRNHFLRFKVPDTWEYLSKAGFKYDSTFGYADCIGFRNGMCHPYSPYNLNTKSYINIMEIPLIVMDITLFDTYMRLTHEEALEQTKVLIDKVAELHGVFTLLWHNNRIVKSTWECDMYENILSYCNEKNAWITSGKEIYEWISGDNNEW